MMLRMVQRSVGTFCMMIRYTFCGVRLAYEAKLH